MKRAAEMMVYSLHLTYNSAVHLSNVLLKYFQRAPVKCVILIVNHPNVIFEVRKALRSALKYSLQWEMSISDMLLFPGNPSLSHWPNSTCSVSSTITETIPEHNSSDVPSKAPACSQLISTCRFIKKRRSDLISHMK